MRRRSGAALVGASSCASLPLQDYRSAYPSVVRRRKRKRKGKLHDHTDIPTFLPAPSGYSALSCPIKLPVMQILLPRRIAHDASISNTRSRQSSIEVPSRSRLKSQHDTSTTPLLSPSGSASQAIQLRYCYSEHRHRMISAKRNLMYAIAAVAATQVYSKPTESRVVVAWGMWMRYCDDVVCIPKSCPEKLFVGMRFAQSRRQEEEWRSAARQQSQRDHESQVPRPDPNLTPAPPSSPDSRAHGIDT